MQTTNRKNLKTTLRTFFEKTVQARGLKLDSYVPLVSFYNKILKKYIFQFLWPKMGFKMCQNVVFSTNINIHILVFFRPFTWEKMISSWELEGTARTRPNILKIVLGPYVQYCPCEASEQKLGQKPESELKVIELSYCHHSICL